MKTYNNEEAKRIHTKTWTATGKNGSIQIKAILKENAVNRIKDWDSSITENDVTLFNGMSSGHQVSVDEIVEIGIDLFQIKVKQD